MRSRSVLFGTVSATHLAAAVATWSAGVPLASPVVLAVVGVAAAALGVAGPREAAEARRRRRDRHRLGRLRAVGVSAER